MKGAARATRAEKSFTPAEWKDLAYAADEQAWKAYTSPVSQTPAGLDTHRHFRQLAKRCRAMAKKTKPKIKGVTA